MEKQWRSSPRPSEQEPPAAQQSEAIPGVDAAPGEISHEETVCEGCGRPYSRAHKKELGQRALETGKQEVPKVSKSRFETPEEVVRDFSRRNPERAAQIRNRFSPEWDLGEWERIGGNWELPRNNTLPRVPKFHEPLQ